RTIKLRNTANTGLPTTNFDQGDSTSSFGATLLGFGCVRLWKMLIKAGNKVSALSTATKTLIADEKPITAKKSIPTSDKPQTAIITVIPAKITALPAVPTAKPIALIWSDSVLAICLYLNKMNNA